MNIEIILRTHNLSNVHKDRQRYFNISKTKLIQGCLTSLIRSANMLVGHDVSYVVLDDHSTDELIDSFDDIFALTSYPYQIINLDQRGHNYSGLKQFEYCKNSTADIVYSVEDDYLHCSSALVEMVEAYVLFKQKMQKEVCIYPFDMPDDYVPPWLEPCYVVHGTKRHWKTGTWTTQTMMCNPCVFNDYWAIFEELANGYDPNTHLIHEGNTISKIWKNHVPRFSPIPSLALHMQFDTQVDPFIDWKMWWGKYSSFSNSL